MPRPKSVGIILAGGRSSRMGQDKAHIYLQGKSLLRHVIDRISPQVQQMAINVHHLDHQTIELFKPYGLRLCEDISLTAKEMAQEKVKEGLEQTHQGPLIGIASGLKFARSQGADYMLSVPCDAPFLPETLEKKLLEGALNINSKIAIAASNGRTHPVIGLWHCSLLEDLMQAITQEGIRKIDRWSNLHNPAIIEWEALPSDPFLNLNRPEDLKLSILKPPNI